MSGATHGVARTASRLLVARIAVPRPRRRIGDVVEMVAWQSSLSCQEICGPRRLPVLFRARAAVCWIAVELGLGSTTVIGRVLGGRHYSTIIAARQRAEGMRADNPDFLRMTNRIRDHFRDLQED